MVNSLDSLANESQFPGNIEALGSLRQQLATKSLVGFIGAGASVPLAPSWLGLLQDLISEGERNGCISAEDGKLLTQQVHEDALEVASSLEEAFTPALFRATIAKRFILDGRSTETHDLIIKLPISSLLTLNYDDGLSTAYVREFQTLPRVIRTDDRFDLHRWTVGHTDQAPTAIIHWHGVAAAPDRMILTADDYNRFYSIKENSAFIEDLWRSKRLFVIGFGYKDPFLVRLAEGVLRNASTDNQHGALIGRSESEPLTPLLRRQFTKKFRINPVFYPVVKDAAGKEDHSALRDILTALHDVSSPHKSPAPVIKVHQSSTILSPLMEAERELKSGLFVGPNGQTLYVEPRLLASTTKSPDASLDEVFKSVEDVVTSNESYLISTPMEAGATTLARRLAVEYARRGVETYVRDATALPKHKRALSEDKAFKTLELGERRAIILDRFSPLGHERIIKEVCGLGNFTTLIILTRAQSDEILTIQDLGLEINFSELTLSYLHRQDIRALAADLYDTFDSDTVSAAVEKTYSDLLELCIPLTPLNVIMYLSVVHREGSFTPLNRLQIMERFIRDLLHRPSDVYRDSFNAENKIDVIGAFIFQLYMESKSGFTQLEWNNFCTGEMKDSMTWFDKDTLLNDLEMSRVLIKLNGIYYLRYKLYYAYFVGKFVAQRPLELSKFMEEGFHLNLDNLVEIIAGVSKDNTSLVTDLVERLERAISEFEGQYATEGFDPYIDVEWHDTDTENKDIWEPVAEKLAAGPASEGEVDKLKRSIVAETRTADQSVVIREFSDYQRSVSFNQVILSGALRESQRLPAELKMRSMRSIYRAYRIFAQIGFLFAPIIATRKFFGWNNIAFYNSMNFDGYAEASDEKKAAMVAGALPRAIIGRAADDLGSRRLGTIYENMVAEDHGGFGSLMTFALLLRSKPEDWEKTARKLLDGIDRKALYLRYMLSSAMRQFNQEVNTNAERTALKRTVAIIQAKRDVRKALPNSKAIGSALKRLEFSHFFDQGANPNPIADPISDGGCTSLDTTVEAASVEIGQQDFDPPLISD